MRRILMFFLFVVIVAVIAFTLHSWDTGRTIWISHAENGREVTEKFYVRDKDVDGAVQGVPVNLYLVTMPQNGHDPALIVEADASKVVDLRVQCNGEELVGLLSGANDGKYRKVFAVGGDENFRDFEIGFVPKQ